MIGTWYELILAYVINLIWECLLKTHTMVTNWDGETDSVHANIRDDRIAPTQSILITEWRHVSSRLSSIPSRVSPFDHFLCSLHNFFLGHGCWPRTPWWTTMPQVESFGWVDGQGSNRDPTQIFRHNAHHTSPLRGSLTAYSRIYWSIK